MSHYPCPNPFCPHVFQAAEVQASAALKCPVCGQVFQFRASPPLAAKRDAPRPKPSAAKTIKHSPKSAPSAPLQSIPLAKPVNPSKQAPPPIESLPAPTLATEENDPLITVAGRSGSSWKRSFFVTGGMLLSVILIVAAVFGVRLFLETTDKSAAADKSHTYVFKARNLNNVEEKAFKLVMPEKGWASDNTIRQRLGAVTAWRSVDQDAWFAVAARDYGQAKPRDAELVRLGIERLEQYFEGGLELAEKPEPAKWSGTEGQRLLFKGQLNAVTWRGYVYMLTHQGFGYWLYVAAPSEDEAQALYASTLDAGANGFFPDTARKGWREQPPKMKDLRRRTKP